MPSTEEQKAASLRWYYANRDRQLELRRAYYKKNREKLLAASRAWKLAHPEIVRRLNRESAKRNPETVRKHSRAGYERRKARLGMEGLRAYQRTIRKRPKYMAINAEAASRRRLAAKHCADKESVLAFYREARRLTEETGVPHEVDHIIPLKHPLVCGLHNKFNLQVLTAEANGRKKNKFDLDAYNKALHERCKELVV